MRKINAGCPPDQLTFTPAEAERLRAIATRQMQGDNAMEVRARG